MTKGPAKGSTYSTLTPTTLNAVVDAMTSTVHSLACDYLHSYTLPIAPTLSSERAEFAHISEQISSLDDHISQLLTLRDALHLRSRQLRNLMSPIHALPTEVLSYIFQQLVDLCRVDCDDQVLVWHQRCLAEALNLRSVSSHFRRVTFDTPYIWKRIALCMMDRKAIDQASFLLQHCIAIAPSVNICVFEKLSGEEARSAVDILFTPDVTQKIKAFELSHSARALDVWMEKLKRSSFPVLDTLKIEYSSMTPSFDFGMLKTLTRLHISNWCLNRPIILPESVQYLYIRFVTRNVLASVFDLCPNLVECTFIIDRRESIDLDDDTQFTEPLTLNCLKQLSVEVLDVDKTSSFAQNLRLPSLETLKLKYYRNCKSISIIFLCCNVSATLTTLVLNQIYGVLDYDDLYQVCRIPFPKLRTLEIFSGNCEPFMRAIHALALPDGENRSLKIHHLPALNTVKFRYSDMQPRYLLDLLKEWKIDDIFYFHIHLRSCGKHYNCWSPELREELRSVVGNRRIEVTWGEGEV